MSAKKIPIWRSTDYFEVSFLVAKGYRVLGVEGQPPRKTFLLHDPEPAERESLLIDYRLGRDMVSASDLFLAQRNLQRLLRG